MKQWSFLLIFALTFALSGCCYEEEYNSIEEYKRYIERSRIGYSDFEIDYPDYFLPSLTFLSDYTYLEGEYYFYENSAFCDFCSDYWIPNRSLIILKYDSDTYLEAKNFMLNEIPVLDNKYYNYGNYSFYHNVNFRKSFTPDWFTMACYNDENDTLCFLGFQNSYPKLDEKYLNDMENNWMSFIDTYYGEYFDFSK